MIMTFVMMIMMKLIFNPNDILIKMRKMMMISDDDGMEETDEEEEGTEEGTEEDEDDEEGEDDDEEVHSTARPRRMSELMMHSKVKPIPEASSLFLFKQHNK